MTDYYFDAATGTWVSDDDGASPEHREEDDAPETVDVADRRHEDPRDDPAFREAERGHRELSGRERNYGRRKTVNSTGRRGQRVVLGDDAPRTSGRRLGAPAPGAAAREGDDMGKLEALLGQDRIHRIRVSMTKPGRPTTQERADRAYVAKVLQRMDSTEANRAATFLLLGNEDDMDKAMRKLGDLRRRTYPPELEAAAERELEERARQPMPPLQLDTEGRPGDHTFGVACLTCGRVFRGKADEARFWLREHACEDLAQQSQEKNSYDSSP
jgi:hypothetical protein